MQNISSPVLTSRKIKGEGGISINLALVDSLTEEVVKTGPEAAAKVEILVLEGDYAGHRECNGKSEDFNNRIVTEMEGKKSVLQGTTTLKLKEGISSITNLSFTQNSQWMRNSKLCLGARAVNSFPGTTIEPANTKSFVVKDNRTECEYFQSSNHFQYEFLYTHTHTSIWTIYGSHLTIDRLHSLHDGLI